ncbi:hypothetical protein [Bacillus massilinigeriensis]|uniref:hypothetical protein n=1 Tax=Bacillus massilionigeriensis TaxID=1805475 RepID=UPI00156EF756|nr:hypothetical protein [Bacillus massilionigeriensis]
MEGKPFYYDGSIQLDNQSNEYSSIIKESFQLTDEMRKSIGRNPYSIESNE